MKQKILVLLMVMMALWPVKASTELKQQPKYNIDSCAHAQSLTLINPLFPFTY